MPTPAKTANLGLIGCGARMRAVFHPHPSIRVVGVYDPAPESVRDTLAQYTPTPRAYASYQELVADPEIDWVGIGSWNSQHREHVVAALKAGKHVFCEKPLATTLDDCLAIREAWQTSGKMFSFGLVLRYSPFYQKIAALIREGAIGEIISFEFNETLEFNHAGAFMSGWRRHRKNAGSFLLEKCCHDMDLANWLVGSLPIRVASFGGTNFYLPKNRRHIDRIGRNAEGQRAYQTWPGIDLVDPFSADKDIVDNQVALLEFANGARASFHANCNAGIQERRFYLCGTEGAIRGDVLVGRIELQRIGFNEQIQMFDPGAAGGHGGGDQTLWPSMLASMLDGRPPLVGIDEAIKSSIVCFAIDQARDEGKIIDVRPMWKRAGIDVGS